MVKMILTILTLSVAIYAQTVGDDETVVIGVDEVVEVDNTWSFQNTSSTAIRWSVAQFSDTNYGSICYPTGERVFSSETKIYFKTVKPLSYSIDIQVRGASL